MAKRKARECICSNCLADILYADTYRVEKVTEKAKPKLHGNYYTFYCKQCVESANNYYCIHTKPKIK